MAETSVVQRTPWLEWIMGCVGGALLICILVVLVSNGVKDHAPPAITARIEKVERTKAGYAMSFVARNEGDVTAAGVLLRAQVSLPNGEREEKEVTFDYLPPHSERRGGFLFAADPRAGQLKIEADGYVDP